MPRSHSYPVCYNHFESYKQIYKERLRKIAYYEYKNKKLHTTPQLYDYIEKAIQVNQLINNKQITNKYKTNKSH